MYQIYASIEKTFKEFKRNKVIITSTMGIPLVFIILLPILMFKNESKEILPFLKGYNALAQISLLIMITGMSNLSGSIVADRERGLYRKLASMPISPYKEVLGRIIAAMIFSIIGILFFIIVSILYNSKFSFDLPNLLVALVYLILMFITASGIGLIIASFVKGESAATHLGISISLLCFFIGIGTNYTQLPDILQIFYKINPLTISFASLISLLEGQEYIGFNPLNIIQIIFAVTFSVFFFSLGFILYSKIAWRKK